MKKILFVLIATCGYMVSQAQPGPAAPSTVNVAATLLLNNALELQVNGDNDFQTASVSGTFNTEEDYENGVVLTQGANFNNLDHLPFSYSSTKNVNITLTTPATFTGSNGGNNLMPRTVLLYSVLGNTTGGTAPGGFTTVGATNTIIAGGLSGPDSQRAFDLYLVANPGFGFPAGTYSMNIMVTATQL